MKIRMVKLHIQGKENQIPVFVYSFLNKNINITNGKGGNRRNRYKGN